LSLAFAVILFVIERRRVRDLLEGGAKIIVVSPNLLLTLSALFLTIALHPMIEAAKAVVVGALHGVSATLYWLKAVLVAILAWRLTGQR
jgi:siroheme synthase (precorrin-2 oxidase/ferrochelatase)